jgi:hypothetical protein
MLLRQPNPSILAGERNRQQLATLTWRGLGVALSQLSGAIEQSPETFLCASLAAGDGGL